MENNFETVKPLIDANFSLLEQIKAIEFKKLDKDCKAFVYSQLRRTIGVLGKLILDGK